MADWASLPEDLLLSILEKVKDIEDLVVFGSVCKSWNEVIRKNKSCLRRQVPWQLMRVEADDCLRRQIYNLTKKKILPNTLYFPELFYEECIPLNYGWVLLLFRKRARMNLLHPISHFRIDLPPFTTCGQKYIYAIRAAALSANPSESSDFVVMIIHGKWNSYVSYWKPGKRRWTRMSEHDDDTGYNDETEHHDVTYYQDQFYSIDNNGEVWSYTFDNNNIPTRRLAAKTDRRSVFRKYVVGSLGLLLVVGFESFHWYDENLGRSVTFLVYELDLKNGSYKRITNLGDSAIFVGRNMSISVDHASEYQTLRSNHIYFCDEDLGCYSLEDDDVVELRWVGMGGHSSFLFIPSLLST